MAYIWVTKRHTNEFMTLAEKKSSFLRDTKASLNTMSFEGIRPLEELTQVYEYLFNQFVLVGKAIRARELHHKHFYSRTWTTATRLF